MDKAKKRQIKNIISWICIVAVVAFLAVIPMLAEANAEAEENTASILSGTVSSGSITTVVRGGGSLTEEAPVEVTIPYGVKLTEFLVANRDTVTPGDPVATADKVSIMQAIVQVQQTLEQLAEDIADAADAEVSDEVVALAGGRVKQVFVREGDRVQDIMLEHGALAVLSLDGLMAVDLTTDAALFTGDAVTVTLGDGSAVSGWVESVLAGRVTVTVEDKGYAMGDTVTVTLEGMELGTGELYIHNAWKATAFSGTIDEVNVEVEDAVSGGKTLFTLTDTVYTAEFELLTARHRAYQEAMQALFRLYEDNTIRADHGGIVSGVDAKSVHLLENSSQITDAKQYSLEESTILSVIPQDTMTLTITLDERDLSKMSLGQTAQVKVEALGGEIFEATVTAIGTRGTNNGGNSKFAVELTLARGEKMLSGMSATASITLTTTENVLTIPVAALNDDGSKTVVYTGYDEKTGELINPVTVELGVSDGINVQILSGLEAGATCYYTYYDTLEQLDNAV